MPTVLAMLVSIEEENSVTFYLPEEKRKIQLTVTDDLIVEFKAALAEEESYFVTIDPESKHIV